MSVYDRLKSGAWLDRDRVVAYATVFLVAEIAIFVFLVAVSRGAFGILTAPNTTDFISFYAAGSLAWHGHAAQIYNAAIHSALERHILGFSGFHYVYFFYPPVFALVCALLPLLPYLAAYAVWLAVTGLGFGWVVARIVGRREAWLVLAAFPPVFTVLGTGQNAFLTAALFGAGTLVMARRPFTAGLLFGALCLKPQLGLLLPFAFVAGRAWRMVAGAAAAVIALVLASGAVFGLAAWRAFIAAFGAVPGIFAAGEVDLNKFANPFGAVLLVGGGADIAYGVQGIASLATIILVALAWYRRRRLPARAALLAAGTLVATPILLDYDLCFAAIAGAWLVRDAQERGWLDWEKTALALLFVLALFTRPVAGVIHLPLACLLAVALLALVARRAWVAEA